MTSPLDTGPCNAYGRCVRTYLEVHSIGPEQFKLLVTSYIRKKIGARDREANKIMYDHIVKDLLVPHMSENAFNMAIQIFSTKEYPLSL